MYPQCQKHGISPQTMDKDLPEVEHLTNALIVELSSIRLSQNYTWQKFHGWIQALLGRNYPCAAEAASTSSLQAAVVKYEAKRKLLKKKADTSLPDEFNCEEFLLPGRRHKHNSPDSAEKIVQVHPEVEVHRQVNIQLAKELAEKSQELLNIRDKYDKLRQQHEASISRIRNKNKSIKRRDLALQNMDESLQKSKELLAATTEDLEIAEKKSVD